MNRYAQFLWCSRCRSQLASVSTESQRNCISHIARDNKAELHCMKWKVTQKRKERLQLVSYIFGF